MGCDIHAFAEKKIEGGYVHVHLHPPLFDWRWYGLFAFLAGVRNYSAVTPIAQPRGLPKDLSSGIRSIYEDDISQHTESWLDVKELLDFNYEASFEDRRERRQLAPNLFSGAETADVGKGLVKTYRDFIGLSYFEELERLKMVGVDRIVFWFDN